MLASTVALVLSTGKKIIPVLIPVPVLELEMELSQYFARLEIKLENNLSFLKFETRTVAF